MIEKEERKKVVVVELWDGGTQQRGHDEEREVCNLEGVVISQEQERSEVVVSRCRALGRYGMHRERERARHKDLESY